MAYRYYSTLRQLMEGGIPFPKQPGESITTIVNFEEGRTRRPRAHLHPGSGQERSDNDIPRPPCNTP